MMTKPRRRSEPLGDDAQKRIPACSHAFPRLGVRFSPQGAAPASHEWTEVELGNIVLATERMDTFRRCL